MGRLQGVALEDKEAVEDSGYKALWLEGQRGRSSFVNQASEKDGGNIAEHDGVKKTPFM